MGSTAAKYKVLLVEPSEMVAAGLAQMINRCATLHLVHRFADLQECREARLKRMAPDVVILNPSVVGYTHRYMVRAQFDCLPDVVLVALAYNLCDEELMMRYDACITLNDSQQRIEKKITQAAERSAKGDEKEKKSDLSAREKEVLVAVARGLTNKEIADALSLSVFTVVTHRKNITRKLGIHSISGLTVYAMLNKLMEAPDL